MKKLMTRVTFALLLNGTLFVGIPSVQARDLCNNETVEGTYGGAATGFAIVGSQVVHLAVAGTATFDGQGNISGGATDSINGVIEQGNTFEGTYTVNANCTGSTRFTAHHPDHDDLHNFDMVIVNNGKEILLIETDPGVVFTISLKRQ